MVTSDTTLLDICCGTGTLGIAFAASVARVVGIDICEEAIADARANAARNQVVNCDFIAKPADKGINDVLTKAGGGPVVGLLDPPRAGLHKCVQAIAQRGTTASRFGLRG